MTKAKQTSNGNSKTKTNTQKSNTGRNSTTRSASHQRDARATRQPPPVRKRMPRPAALPRLSSYALSLLDRKSDSAQKSAGDLQDQVVPTSWLTTRQASRRSGYSIRHIQNLCDLGFFLEGEDWKQRPPRPGVSRRGHIYINPAALKKLDWTSQ